MQKKGLFIVFEGIDGSGTSTHVHRLAERIEQFDKYQDVLKTHEPWRSQEIKSKLEKDAEIYSDAEEITNLFIDDRARHTQKLIRPNLEAEVHVLCSRYKMSTCAYQWSQGMSISTLLQMHENRGILMPDITFFLDIPREVAQERIKTARKTTEKFENDPTFVDKLISAYNALIFMSRVDSRYFGNIVKVNANREIKEVEKDIYQNFLNLHK